jgi:hypothetical protein
MTDGDWLARACSPPRHGRAPRRAGRARLAHSSLVIGGAGRERWWRGHRGTARVAVPPRDTPRHCTRALWDHARRCDVCDCGLVHRALVRGAGCATDGRGKICCTISSCAASKRTLQSLRVSYSSLHYPVRLIPSIKCVSMELLRFVCHEARWGLVNEFR